MPQQWKLFKVGFNPDYLLIAEDAVIYAHHADDHDESINEQIKYLEVYNTWRTCWILQPPHNTANFKDNNWLLGSTIFGLFGYVKSILGIRDKRGRGEVLEALLHALCSSAHFELSVPFPKGKMVRVLLELSSDYVYGLPYSLPRLKAGPLWPHTFDKPGTVQRFGSTTLTPRLMESYIAVLEAFLAAGIDPTDIPSGVPPDYLLCHKSFKLDLFRELSLSKVGITAITLFNIGKTVFDCSVCAHRLSKITGIVGNYKGETSKRKFVDESEAGESSDSGQDVEFFTKDKRLKSLVEQGVVSELLVDNDVIYLGERPVYRGQSVEVKEDD